jgi:hypothetical protein
MVNGAKAGMDVVAADLSKGQPGSVAFMYAKPPGMEELEVRPHASALCSKAGGVRS